MKRNQLIAACLGSVFCLASQSWSSTAVAGQIAVSELTDSQYVTLLNAVGPVRTPLAADPVAIASITKSVNLDGATITGCASSGQSYCYWDGTNINIMTSGGGHQRLFQAAPSATYTASGTFVLAEVQRDGSNSPSSPGHFTVGLTKGSTAGTLTSAQLVAWLTGLSNTAALAASSSAPTTLTSTTATTAGATGWVFTGYFADATPTAQAWAIDPIAATLTLSLTPVGATTAQTYTTAIKFYTTSGGNYTWFQNSGSTTPVALDFTGPTGTGATGGTTISAKYYPGQFTGTLLAGASSAWTGMSDVKRIHQINNTTTGVYEFGFKKSLSAAVTASTTMMGGSPTSIEAGLIAEEIAALNAPTTTVTNFTSLDSGKLGITALGSAGVTVDSKYIDTVTDPLTGAAVSTGIVIMAHFGTGASASASMPFYLNLGTSTSLTSASTPRGITAWSPARNALHLVCFDATGYSGTTTTDLAATLLPLLPAAAATIVSQTVSAAEAAIE